MKQIVVQQNVVDVGRLATYIPTIHAVRGYTGKMEIVHCTQCGY